MNFRDVRGCFSRKGFEKHEGGRHEKYYHTDDGGRSDVLTVLSRQSGGTTVSLQLQGSIARQLKLSIAQFQEFVSCSISKEEYRDIVKSREDSNRRS